MKHILGRFLVLVAVTSPLASAQGPILGILEENQGHFLGDPNYRSVRVVFEKKSEEWLPFPSDCPDQECLRSITSSYPKEVNWIISLDGRKLGQVVGHLPDQFHYYADVGQQTITRTNPVPTIGNRSTDFGGFTEAAVYRPLVANSEHYFADPEHWKPVALSPELMPLLRQGFREKFPRLCRNSPTDEGKLEQFPYRDDEVKVVKAYSSKSHKLVARLHLPAVDCEDTEASFEMGDPWFLVSRDKVVTYLDSGIWLVDAGDYDNDGKSEVIFSIDRENEGGYEIWYNDFKKCAAFRFHYH